MRGQAWLARHAIACQGGVGSHQFFQRGAAATQNQAQVGRGPWGMRIFRPALRKWAAKRAGPMRSSNHCWHVERALQRLAHAHRAVERCLKVARRVVAKILRCIDQQASECTSPSSSASAYRKGLSVEPGERTARTMSTWAAPGRIAKVGAARVASHSQRAVLHHQRGYGHGRGQIASLSSSICSSRICSLASRVLRTTAVAALRATALDRYWLLWRRRGWWGEWGGCGLRG